MFCAASHPGHHRSILEPFTDGEQAPLMAWLLSVGILTTVAAGVIAFFFTLTGTGMGAYVDTYGIGRRGGGSGRGRGGGFSGGGGGFGGGGASGRW